MTDAEDIRDLVRQRYGTIAEQAGSSCCAPPAPAASSCCGGDAATEAAVRARQMGYAPTDIVAFGDGANLGLGCGNPQAIAEMRSGEVVLDLGSGAGFDCFLAARQVGEAGRVIGVDMTPEMLKKAKANAIKLELANVEFRLGEIEHLPVADATIDVVISNCVINLSPDKPAVLREAFRVLKAGGRLAVSDVVMLKPLPAGLAAMTDLYSCCIAGAVEAGQFAAWLAEAGFADIRIAAKVESRDLVGKWAPDGIDVRDYVASANIQARKL